MASRVRDSHIGRGLLLCLAEGLSQTAARLRQLAGEHGYVSDEDREAIARWRRSHFRVVASGKG